MTSSYHSKPVDALSPISLFSYPEVLLSYFDIKKPLLKEFPEDAKSGFVKLKFTDWLPVPRLAPKLNPIPCPNKFFSEKLKEMEDSLVPAPIPAEISPQLFIHF